MYCSYEVKLLLVYFYLSVMLLSRSAFEAPTSRGEHRGYLILEVGLNEQCSLCSDEATEEDTVWAEGLLVAVESGSVSSCLAAL